MARLTLREQVVAAAGSLAACPSLVRYAALKRAVDALMAADAHLTCVGVTCDAAPHGHAYSSGVCACGAVWEDPEVARLHRHQETCQRPDLCAICRLAETVEVCR